MNFIKLHFEKFILAFMLIVFVQQCNNSSRLSKIEKQEKITNAQLDSMCTTKELNKYLEIEGLKAEKRMIQSTDRKILDVNRQSEIDSEIKKLESAK
ncbi:hypothetical protein UFOVP1604_260 [uncultured Caudovirales phage]|jgi:hypothetical protein|uniref:Uncharacterized protein n=1 Tax=uncultured Caudovirales phage TaxID=2100421 RepID=A0A6J5SXM7_9CAUD|nr:hypothetical protein UFOVP1604_260 [uncultured Caudovirales phage]